jgi:hypothetical protein
MLRYIKVITLTLLVACGSKENTEVNFFKTLLQKTEHKTPISQRLNLTRRYLILEK